MVFEFGGIIAGSLKSLAFKITWRNFLLFHSILIVSFAIRSVCSAFTMWNVSIFGVFLFRRVQKLQKSTLTIYDEITHKYICEMCVCVCVGTESALRTV